MSPEKRLFIIDDERTLLAVLQEYLEQFGLEVFPYEAIPDLEKELKEKKPHAVLLDIVLPMVSGIEILKKIKQIDRRIPVIMMTGYADDPERLESLRNGAYALLTKPFKSLEELYNIVNNSMEHYIETLRAEELASEVEERYRREKMNIIELDFLKNLQHMIGETEDHAFVLENAHKLLRSFLEFEFFGTILMYGEEANIRIFPGVEGNPELLRDMASVLVLKMPGPERIDGRRVVLQGVQQNRDYFDKVDDEAVDTKVAVAALSTVDRVYGCAALYRKYEFDPQEESIFARFCSHIALTLEKIRLFNEIKILSIHDGLTGAYNHVYIIGELENEVERARRHHTPFSVVMFDVDDFKMVNDKYGHLAGDYVLKKITQAMKENLRTIDKIGRYGGEEFLIILSETDSDKAVVVAERLRNSVETLVLEFEDNRIKITVSGGVASYVEGLEAKEIIKKADHNLYHAKKSGKNRTYYEKYQ